MTPPYAAVSVDLDTTWCYREIHGLPPRPTTAASAELDAAYEVGVQRLLAAFDDWGIPSTLFAIGRDLESPSHAALLRDAVAAGHEVASHSYAHAYDLRRRRIWEIRDDLQRAHRRIEDAVGVAPVGFRTPGYNVDERILSICAELRYAYDSSIFPCPPYWFAKAGVMAWLRARGRPSRSAMTRPKTMIAPLRPYRPNASAMQRRDDRSRLPIEVPICVVPGVRFPIIGTSLHLLGARGFAAAFGAIRAAHPRLLNLEFHAIDFMDAADPGVDDLVAVQPDLAIPWAEKRARYERILATVADHYTFATLRDAVTAIA